MENHVHDNLDFVDLMKFIASILIIFLHTEPLKAIAPTLSFFIINVCIRFSIPFFFMTSGYLFYSKFIVNKNRSHILSNYCKKYLKRMITLYIIWSLVYFPYMIYQTLALNPTDSLIMLILRCLRNVFYSGTSFHLWYFTALIFSIGVIDIWLIRFNLKLLLILSGVLYFIGLMGESYFGLIPQGSLLFHMFTLYFSIFLTTRNGIFFGLFFVVLGAFLFERPLKLKMKVSVLFTAVSFALLALEVLLLTNYSHPKGYNFMFFNIPLGLFLFNTLIHFELPWKLNYKTLRKSSTLIFCLHAAFIIVYSEILGYLDFGTQDENGLLLFPCVMISSLILSLILIRLENVRYIGFIARKMG